MINYCSRSGLEASFYYRSGSAPNCRMSDARTNLTYTPGSFSPGLEAGLETMNDHFTYIGHRHDWGGENLFGINTVDRRQHVYVIGKTGSGKSTLLRNLVVQHIAAGDGVGLIDPHGDLAEELLDQIPRRRTRDTVRQSSSCPRRSCASGVKIRWSKPCRLYGSEKMFCSRF